MDEYHTGRYYEDGPYEEYDHCDYNEPYHRCTYIEDLWYLLDRVDWLDKLDENELCKFHEALGRLREELGRLPRCCQDFNCEQLQYLTADFFAQLQLQSADDPYHESQTPQYGYEASYDSYWSDPENSDTAAGAYASQDNDDDLNSSYFEPFCSQPEEDLDPECSLRNVDQEARASSCESEAKLGIPSSPSGDPSFGHSEPTFEEESLQSYTLQQRDIAPQAEEESILQYSSRLQHFFSTFPLSITSQQQAELFMTGLVPRILHILCKQHHYSHLLQLELGTLRQLAGAIELGDEQRMEALQLVKAVQCAAVEHTREQSTGELCVLQEHSSRPDFSCAPCCEPASAEASTSEGCCATFIATPSALTSSSADECNSPLSGYLPPLSVTAAELSEPTDMPPTSPVPCASTLSEDDESIEEITPLQPPRRMAPCVLIILLPSLLASPSDTFPSPCAAHSAPEELAVMSTSERQSPAHTTPDESCANKSSDTAALSAMQDSLSLIPLEPTSTSTPLGALPASMEATFFSFTTSGSSLPADPFAASADLVPMLQPLHASFPSEETASTSTYELADECMTPLSLHTAITVSGCAAYFIQTQLFIILGDRLLIILPSALDTSLIFADELPLPTDTPPPLLLLSDSEDYPSASCLPFLSDEYSIVEQMVFSLASLVLLQSDHGDVDTWVMLVYADDKAIWIQLGHALLQPLLPYFPFGALVLQPSLSTAPPGMLATTSISNLADEYIGALLLCADMPAFAVAHLISVQLAAVLGDMLPSILPLALAIIAIVADELPHPTDMPPPLLPPHTSSVYNSSFCLPSPTDEYSSMEQMISPLASMMLSAGDHGNVDTFVMCLYADDVMINMWSGQLEAPHYKS